MKAIILAAGFATRLYPLTKKFPKPLLKINKKSIMDHILEKIFEIKGINEVIGVTNNKFYNLFLEWKKDKKGIKIINDGVNSEEEKLGAVGDICFVLQKEKIKEDILIIAGDALFDFSLKEPYEIFKKTNQDLAIFYDLKDKEKVKNLGVAVVKDKKIVDFQEKPIEPKSTLCSVPIYFYKKETLNLIKEFNKEAKNKDQPGLFLEWLYKKVPVYAYVTEGTWVDIGTKESLKEARNLIRDRNKNSK